MCHTEKGIATASLPGKGCDEHTPEGCGGDEEGDGRMYRRAATNPGSRMGIQCSVINNATSFNPKCDSWACAYSTPEASFGVRASISGR